MTERGVKRTAGVRGGVLLALLALLLAACSVGPSHRPPVAVRGEGTTPPAAAPAPDPDVLPPLQPQRARIQGRDYVDCTADTLEAVAAAGYPVPAGRALRVGCGQLDVDTDPAQATLGSTRLQVLRVGLADAPDTRPPLVVIGDSGVGGSARFAARLATLVSDALLAQYQLVGLDRRGWGADLLDCGPADARSGVVSGRGPLDALLADARDVVSDCYQLLDGAMGTVRSAATAGDLERLRLELRVNRLNVLAVGDGAAAVAAWASAHPDMIGRIVLDSPDDPRAEEPDRTAARLAAAEAAFDAFATVCTDRGDCPLGADPRGAVTGLLAALATRPLASADGDRITPGVAVEAIRAGLAEPQRWPALAAGLAGAVRGDASGLLPFVAPLLGPGGSFDAELATTCNDTARRFTPDEVATLESRWGAQYALFGSAAARLLLACAPWPAPRQEPPSQPLPARAPPVLVLGTAADPRAPQQAARTVAELLGRARFVGWQGAGTGAYPRSACVTELVDGMLADGVVPRDGTLCPA